MKIRKVLSLGLSPEKNTAVAVVCHFMGANYRKIDEKDFHKTMGFLFGALGVKEDPEEYDYPEISSLNGEMLVFAGFEGDDLSVFLEKYRNMKTGPVLFKALLTEYNALWSPVFLYKELEKESKEIKK